MKTFSVYIITCVTNKKKYVGLTCQEVRKRISNGKKYRGKLGAAVKELGWENFTWEVVASDMTLEDAKNLEKQLIAQFDTRNDKYGYNCTVGGECRLIGHAQSAETRKKISNTSKSKEFSKEHRERISQAKSGTHHHFAKKLYQYDLDGNLIRVWDYMSEASKTLGIDKSCISACCLGKIKTSHGFKWSYNPV